MMISRRQFLTGGAVLLGTAALGGGAAFALGSPSDQPHREQLWQAASADERILLAASFAPSSHNTQPWRFVASADGVELHADARRGMGAADPRGREMHVSLGCALESIAIAAAASGRGFALEHVGGDGTGHFERVRFTGSSADYRHAELADAVPRRRTNRAAFDAGCPVDATALDALAARCDSGEVRMVWLTEPKDRAAFTDLSSRATERHVADAAMQRDSHRWYRMRAADAERQRDGITVSGANLRPIGSALFTLLPPTPESFDAGWAKATAETHCGTAPAFGVLVVERPGDRAAWLAAGRAYLRMQLEATKRGLATHPISQALAIRDRELAEGAGGEFANGLASLAGPGEVALAFRIGYPTREQAESLRRPPVVKRA